MLQRRRLERSRSHRRRQLGWLPRRADQYKGVRGANWGDDKGEGRSYDLPSRNPLASGSFDGLKGADGALFRCDEPWRLRLQHLTDRLSTTLQVDEDQPRKNRWGSWPYANNAYGACAIPPNVNKPDASEYNPFYWHYTWSFRSAHPSGLHFALADGSVRWVRNDIDLATNRAVATIRGNERVGKVELD